VQEHDERKELTANVEIPAGDEERKRGKKPRDADPGEDARR